MIWAFLEYSPSGQHFAKAVEQAYGLVSVQDCISLFWLVFENAGEDIRATAYRLKWVSVLLFVVPSLALFWFAHEIIAVLFDHRYSR